MKKLTDKQKRYAAERIAGKEPVVAVLSAGYQVKPAFAKKIAFDNEHEPRIEALIAERTEKVLAKAEVTREWIATRLREVAERCLVAEPVMIGRGEDRRESGEYVFDASGANRALELLGKDLGMFVERKISMDLTNMSIEEQEAKLAELRGKYAE